MKINLPDIVPKAYHRLFKMDSKRYTALKGSRGSAKSYTIALWIVHNMMLYPLANTLVLRRYGNTLEDSVFVTLKWAINRLGVKNYWKCTTRPMKMTYLPTGQTILFRGLDEGTKVTSITVEHGELCWAWFEEAYELYDKELDFNKVDMSLRGKLPEGYYKKIFLSFNPWFDFWIKDRFFGGNDMTHSEDNIEAFTTTYKDNPYLGDDDTALFDAMKAKYPKRYRIEGEGHWGVAEGLIYEDVSIKEFTLDDVSHLKELNGLDFGYSSDPTAFIKLFADTKEKTIYVYDSFGRTRMSNADIVKELKSRFYHKNVITCDSAEPKSIDEMRVLGCSRLKKARKGADSILSGIKFLQSYKIVVHPQCEEVIQELMRYSWKKNQMGDELPAPEDTNNHWMDAMRYAVEDIRGTGKLNSFNKSLLGL